MFDFEEKQPEKYAGGQVEEYLRARPLAERHAGWRGNPRDEAANNDEERSLGRQRWK